MMTINFSKAFYVFHKIFFRNDYWIFDPNKDPIINALPEELFMIEAALIIILLLIFTLVIKVLYLKNKKIK
jgi:integral membrane protein (TIGR01906 family)